jgi:hypothetical protein
VSIAIGGLALRSSRRFYDCPVASLSDRRTGPIRRAETSTVAGLFSAVTAIITSFLVAERGTRNPLSDLERLAALARNGDISTGEYELKRGELISRI